MLSKETIKDFALANGFKLKEQTNGEMDLNPYVYDTINKAIAFYESKKNGGWISIDDDLPKVKGRYLCYYPKSGKQTVEPFMLEHTLNDKDYMQALGISHWQPTPQNPQE
ncbi:DUF551 domain-containing protein [Moraxella sp. ZY210820]|uniref:DUF551 domain-containing protein n=1 Tax=Moraxella sp. ZY210820 TaxID=2904123 RepID=UPI002731FE66|nr:DUF551 domain-containing protein [Moraxella sp. ZY210820]WLF84801.1 DUF551 domain-containing protein [Moraxella sp. ZY210820]